MNIEEFLRNINNIGNNNKDNPPTSLNHIESNAGFNELHDIVYKDLYNQERFDYDDIKKYERAGVSWNPRDAATGSLDIQLADSQSNWAKFGNALSQTLVSEIILGTALGISDLVDAVGQAVGASDHNYQNPVSRYLEELQDTFNNEVVPIYSRPDSGFANGTDFGWWMQNIPSIASSLTLLLPAAGTTKLVSLGGKLARGARASRLISKSKAIAKAAEVEKDVAKAASLTKKGEKWARRAERYKSGNLLGLSSENAERLNLFMNNGMTPALSRTMENYQESRQVYNDMYSEAVERLNNMTDEEYERFLELNKNTVAGIDTSNRSEVAKAIARKSADTTFKDDWSNVVFDIIELYALRNVPFAGFRSVSATTKGRALERGARRFAGKYKSVDELEKLISSQSFKRKALDFGDDLLYGGKHVILGQANEGVEEAVNYIAQQEGMYVGKSILNMESEHNVFSDRLNQYMKNSELWESAFWGLMGGIVFQGAGSGLNRLSTARKRAKAEKERAAKANEKTGENPNAKNTWSELFETTDFKREKAALERRIAVENVYEQLVKQIESGVDPFTNNEIKSEEERQLALERALQSRRTAMALDAMDSGTGDMLEAYIADNNVKQALIDKGLITKEQADKAQAEDLRAIQEVKRKYDENVSLLNSASYNIMAKTGKTIPTEYLQIIARNNIEAQFAIEDYEKQLANFTNEALKLEETFKDKLDPNLNYKEVVQLQWLTRQLGELEVEKRELLNDKEAVNTISGQERLRTINNNIDNIRQMVANLSEENKMANLLFAIENSFSLEKIKIKNEEGKEEYVFENTGRTKEYLDFRQLIADLENQSEVEVVDSEGKSTPIGSDAFEKIDKRLIGITKEDIKQQKVLDQKATGVLSTISEYNINKISKDLGTAWATLSALQLRIASERSKLVKTDTDIENEAERIHNYLNAVREKKIQDSIETIRDLANTYGAEPIRKIINDNYNGKIPNYDEAKLSAEDKDRMKDVVDTLNLGNKMNKNLALDVDTILANWNDIKAGISAGTKHDVGENSSASQELILDNQNKNQIIPSTDNQKPQETPETRQNEQIQQPKPTKFANGLNVTNVSDGVVINDDKGNLYDYEAIPNTNTFKVNFYDRTEVEPFYNNPELFNQEEHLNIIDLSSNDYFEFSPLIIDKDGNVVNKGLIVRSTEENLARFKQKEESERAKKETINNSSTGVEEQNNDDVKLPDDIDGDRSPMIDITDICNKTCITAISNAKKANKPIDWNNVRSELNKLFGEEGKTSQIVKQEIERSIKTWEEAASRNNIPSVNAVVEIVTKASAITEATPENDSIRKAFASAVSEFLRVYGEEIGFDNINGKQYINIEALCRYCDEVLGDKLSNSLLVDNLINYIKENKNVISTDKDLDSIKQNLIKNESNSELSPTVGIGFLSVMHDVFNPSSIVSNKTNKIVNLLDNVQIGDKVTVTRNKKGFTFSINNIKIGNLPLPNVYKNNGLWQWNDGWKTDITETNGVLSSDLMDLFIYWATDNSDSDIKELNDIIVQYIYETNENEKDKLRKKFEDNKVIQKAYSDGFIDNSQADPLNGIAKIWKYTRYNGNGTSRQQIADMRKEDIINWFKKQVAPSFRFLYELENNPNISVEIGQINEGKLIVTEGSTLPVSKAIGSDFKDKVRLGVSEDSTSITVAGGGINGTTKINRSFTIGQTFVVIPTRDGSFNFIHAYPQSFNSSSISSTAKRINKAIFAEIARIASLTNVTKQEQVNELEMFLRKLLPSYYSANQIDSTTSFFIGKGKGSFITIRDNSKNNVKTGFSISYRVPGERVTTYINVLNSGDVIIREQDPNIKGYTTKALNISLTDALPFIQKAIEQNCNYNVSFEGINSDQDSSARQSLTKRENGKLVIDIPNQEQFTFDSYNDFILKNDLIQLSTKPTKDGKSNFERMVDNPTGSIQNISVRYKSSSSPVEKNDNIQSNNIETPTANEITSILDNIRITNKGENIAKLVFGNNVKKQFKKLGVLYKLFSKNVIFVDKNIGNNAITNVENSDGYSKDLPGVLMKAKTVYIGREWMELMTSNDEEKKKEAIRKLVHEQLHLIFAEGNNEKYLEQIREIFDEFAKRVDRNNEQLVKYLYLQNKARYYTNDAINNEGLEEFLIESLTSKELINSLNGMTIDNNDISKGKESLWQKLMKILAKVFGINIEENSLYEREFKLLGDIIGNPKQTKINFDTTVTEEKRDNVEQIKTNDEEIEKEEDDEEYVPINEDEDTIDFIQSRNSSISENNKTYSSTSTFINTFPIEEQAKVANKIENGEINISCKL